MKEQSLCWHNLVYFWHWHSILLMWLSQLPHGFQDYGHFLHNSLCPIFQSSVPNHTCQRSWLVDRGWIFFHFWRQNFRILSLFSSLITNWIWPQCAEIFSLEAYERLAFFTCDRLDYSLIVQSPHIQRSCSFIPSQATISDFQLLVAWRPFWRWRWCRIFQRFDQSGFWIPYL